MQREEGKEQCKRKQKRSGRFIGSDAFILGSDLIHSNESYIPHQRRSVQPSTQRYRMIKES
jgi:hypothetical protein